MPGEIEEISSLEASDIYAEIPVEQEIERSKHIPAHMAAPFLAMEADNHFQTSLQNVMKISQQNNLVLSELLPVVTKLGKEKAKFDALEEDETHDMSAFNEEFEKLKTLYRALKSQGESVQELANTCADKSIDKSDAEAYLNKIFPDDLDLENMDRWDFEELKENLSHWRDSLKRDIDFNTNSLFAVLQLYISCQNVMQNMTRNEIESNANRVRNQIPR
ncbi:hypothetical protein COB21_03545 [Candidatus Aerophobetes bacterium]|uniref:Uncharacterized protein n=1 Tax=Aerophobetes bacterium TaxID=2030807 RepID=A0A2A4X4Q0_UNCAE|nr:MAG: hypothetical protein COB21_03545 [Candidatus Aerophobetes bacterium]